MTAPDDTLNTGGISLLNLLCFLSADKTWSGLIVVSLEQDQNPINKVIIIIFFIITSSPLK